MLENRALGELLLQQRETVGLGLGKHFFEDICCDWDQDGFVVGAFLGFSTFIGYEPKAFT